LINGVCCAKVNSFGLYEKSREAMMPRISTHVTSSLQTNVVETLKTARKPAGQVLSKMIEFSNIRSVNSPHQYGIH
jgi:hypothetical protein